MYLGEYDGGLGFGIKSLKKAVKKVAKAPIKVIKSLVRAPLIATKLPVQLIKDPRAAPKLLKKAAVSPFSVASKITAASLPFAPKVLKKAAAAPWTLTAKTGVMAKFAASGLKRLPVWRPKPGYKGPTPAWALSAKQRALKDAVKIVAPAAAAQVQAGQPATPAPVIAAQSAEVVKQALAREGVNISSPEAEEAVQEAVEETQAAEAKSAPAWGKLIIPAVGAALLLFNKG
jgi:hypothetical protein